MNMNNTESNALLEAVAEIESLKAQLAFERKKGNKAPPMEKLNCLFPKTVKRRIKSIADAISISESTGLTESDLTRTAMHYGLQKMELILSENGESGERQIKGQLHIEKIRAMFNK